MKLFVRQGCSDCDKLKAAGIPKDVMLVDCSTADGLGEAAWEDVYVFPVLLGDDGKRFESYDSIKEQLWVSTPK